MLTPPGARYSDSRTMSSASSSAFSRVEQSVRRRTSVSPRIVQDTLFAESPSLTLRPSYLRGKYDAPQRDLDFLKTPLLRVGDDDELDGQPTVLLVKKSSSSIGLENSRDLEYLGHTERRDVLEPIPLTPRPELQTRTETASSAITRNSELPRLPTPDFASPRLDVLDYLRGGNVETPGSQVQALCLLASELVPRPPSRVYLRYLY